MSGPVATVFLDRDGVINQRIMDGYVRHEAEFILLPGSLAALLQLFQLGLRTVVVTNQRGIARGLMSAHAVATLHHSLSQQVAAAGGCLKEFYVCPHDRNQGCGCRKPDPGLLDQANVQQAVAWDRSFLVGDSDSDIQAGQARGVTTIKVAGPSLLQPDYQVPALPQAVSLISDLVHKLY